MEGRGGNGNTILVFIKFSVKEAALLFYLLLSFLTCDQLLKVRICSPWSKFFSLRVNPILNEGFLGPGTGSHKSCFP